MMIRTIYFDLGNVIVDVDLEKLLTSFAGNSPLDRTQITERLREIEETKLIDLGLISLYDFYAAICKKIKLSVAYVEFEDIFAHIFSPNTPVIDLIEKLNGKFQLGIISNTSEFHYNKIAADIKVIAKLKPKILSFRERAVKPERRIYEIALQRAGTAPFDTLFIDDNIENVNAARDMGMQAIHYTKSVDLKHELTARGIIL